ncbi:hypothetical protein ACFL6I_15145 [candidate division KSB1 bacterium]
MDFLGVFYEDFGRNQQNRKIFKEILYPFNQEVKNLRFYSGSINMALNTALNSRINDCEHELLVSGKFNYPKLIRETLPLAKEIQARGVDVVLTPMSWPRDMIYFYEDETYTEINSKKSDQVRDCTHAAWHGGAYLVGDNFMIGSDRVIPKSKRRATLDVLMVERGIYISIHERLFPSILDGLPVSGNPEFYRDEVWHIDPFFNLGNKKRIIVTYNEEKLEKVGEELAQDIEYKLVLLPIEDAAFAAVGFIELGDSLVVDCRATASMGILQNEGYNIVPTPVPLEEINRGGGSVRCITREMPKVKHKMKFHDFVGGHDDDGPARFSIFSDFEGHLMVMNRGRYKTLRDELFPKEFYS